MQPLVCLALTEATIEKALATAARYHSRADLFELRADFLEDREMARLASVPAKLEKPAILTIRRERDGGRYRGGHAERLRLLLKALGGPYRYVDLEEDITDQALEQAVKSGGQTVIRSLHTMQVMPQDLLGRLKSLKRNANDIPKAAVMPGSSADLIEIVRTARGLAGTPHILIGMGAFGFATRILAAKLGSYLTFCSAAPDKAAPGHITPELLHELYHFKQIGLHTAVYGVIGNPVMHSLSPHIHNPGLRKLNLDAVYLPFAITDPADFFELAGLLDIKGASVTIPHKQAVVPFLDQKDASVERIKACNTIYLQSGRWHGANTDADGFMRPLLGRFKGRIPAGLKATIIGAGGAARACLYALKQYGVACLVLNRTVSKAEALAREFGCGYQALDPEGIRRMKNYNDQLVQTTSIGMTPGIDREPAPDYQFDGSETAYDVIYNPHQTRFLSRAQEAGCTVIHGDQMLIGQALAQFKLFTGHDYPGPEQLTLPRPS